jgi:hypothetical protein
MWCSANGAFVHHHKRPDKCGNVSCVYKHIAHTRGMEYSLKRTCKWWQEESKGPTISRPKKLDSIRGSGISLISPSLGKKTLQEWLSWTWHNRRRTVEYCFKAAALAQVAECEISKWNYVIDIELANLWCTRPSA